MEDREGNDGRSSEDITLTAAGGSRNIAASDNRERRER